MSAMPVTRQGGNERSGPSSSRIADMGLPTALDALTCAVCTPAGNKPGEEMTPASTAGASCAKADHDSNHPRVLPDPLP